MNREMLYLNRSDIEQAGGNHSQVYGRINRSINSPCAQ